MKSLSISVKEEGSGEVCAVLTFGTKVEDEPGPSCVANLKSHHEKDDAIRPTEQKNEESHKPVSRGRTGPIEAPCFENLKAKLGIDFGTCLGKTKKQGRCKNHILKKNLAVAERILKNLENGHFADTRGNPSKQLKTLAELLHCKSRHQEDAPLLSRDWEIVLGLRTEPVPAEEPAVSSTHIRVSRTTRATKDVIPNSTFDTSRTHIRKFVPYDARAQTMKSMESFVEGAVTANLGKQEIEKAGHIYIYWFPGNFGHLKIGVTSRSVEERLREWERRCGHKTHRDEVIFDVPHVYRVEKIVQAQLRDRRKKEIGCKGCGRCHKEWFEVSREVAIAEAKRWSDWMRSNPYEESGNGVWKLKKDEKANLKTLCRSVSPEKHERSVSTSHLKAREERNRRLSVSPIPHRRSDSAEVLRRSPRLVAKQWKKSSAENEIPETSNGWTFKIEAAA